MSADLRVYVASLSDYNSGRLHGVWLDVEGATLEELQGWVASMLSDSPEPIAEEFAIHDSEGFGDLLGEFDGLAKVAALADIRGDLERKFRGDADIWSAYLAYVENGADFDDVSGFEEVYRGEWPSRLAYGENLLEDLGYLSEMPDHLAPYFDCEAWTRDLFLGGDYWSAEADGGVFVFANY